MKKSLLLLIVFLFNLLNAQIQDLENLADGEIVYSSSLSNSNGDLYGYIYFFNQGEAEGRKTKYEYVILDKNLNKVTNGTYNEPTFQKTISNFFDCTLMGDEVLVSKLISKDFKPILTFNQIISLKDNSVSNPFIFENDMFQDLDVANYDQLKEKYKETDSYSMVVAIDYQNVQGFVILENSKYKKDYHEKSIKLYNSEKQQIWSYDYNINETKKNWKDFKILNVNDGLISGGLSYKSNEKFIDEYSIVGLDAETGKQLFEYPLENSESTYSHSVVVKHYDGFVYIIGNYSPYKKSDFDWEKNLGIFSIKLNKQGKEISKKYFTWGEIAKNLDADKYGKVKNGYKLLPKKIFIMKDGSFSFLSEKFKLGNSFIGGATKATDFVLFNFDNNHNLIQNHTIEKDVSKNWGINDYLFSQYIKDDTGVVFFFKDYQKDDETKDKNWILGINTIINGVFNQETIPMSSEDFYINPIPAKEGYILLNEYNKKKEFNQIRLEKLNY